jgi:hypothetical protein
MKHLRSDCAVDLLHLFDKEVHEQATRPVFVQVRAACTTVKRATPELSSWETLSVRDFEFQFATSWIFCYLNCKRRKYRSKFGYKQGHKGRVWACVYLWEEIKKDTKKERKKEETNKYTFIRIWIKLLRSNNTSRKLHLNVMGRCLFEMK